MPQHHQTSTKHPKIEEQHDLAALNADDFYLCIRYEIDAAYPNRG